jgi:peptide/nickel transport system permease protein
MEPSKPANSKLNWLIRFATTLALVLAIFTATRGMIRALPGNPLDTLIAESGTPLSTEILREEFHLDEPFWRALGSDIKRATKGDLGISITTRQPIAPLLFHRMLKTFELTGLSVVFMILLSVSLGLAAADRTTWIGRITDPICTFYGAIVSAMPAPWIGPLLMVVFCVWIPIFPVGDHILLPALTLSLSFTGLWSRLIRQRVRETLETGAAPGARARGIPEWKVLLKYGLAPCSGALLAYLGTQIGGLMAGAFVTETIFDWPGMGDLLITSVLRRDYPVVESAAFIAAVAALLGNALGNWAQNFVDPRIRSEG